MCDLHLNLEETHLKFLVKRSALDELQKLSRQSLRWKFKEIGFEVPQSEKYFALKRPETLYGKLENSSSLRSDY
jgi:hypothetical protein